MTAARIRICVSPDELSASLSIAPGEPLAADDVRAAIAGAGVTFGIDAAALDRLIEHARDPAFATDAVRIASGQAMRRESNDACELIVAVGLRAGQQLDDGTFDYRDRGLLTPVRRGDVVARCTPAVVGLDGRTVTGRVIPFEMLRTKPSPNFGDGLERRDDGQVVAIRDGVARVVEGATITVGDHYIHKGDVDLRSGHLEMRGSLTVGGDVTAKFEAQASGDVEIGKNVVRGTVYAGGSVRVRGGVIGGGGGAVFAELDVSAEHGQAANISCGGAVHLRKAAISCEIQAASIAVDGVVLGGTLQAEHAIVVGSVGAAHGGEGTLVVAMPVERPIRHRFDAQRKEHHRVERLGAQLVVQRRSDHRRPPTSETTIADVLGSPDPLVTSARIDVLGTIHAGCTVVIGPHRMVVDHPHHRCRFAIDPETGTLRCDPLP